MPVRTHFSASGVAPALCGDTQATKFSTATASVTCTQCKATLAGQTTTEPFTKTN